VRGNTCAESHPENLVLHFLGPEGAEAVAQVVNVSWWGDKGELRIGGVIYTARRDKSAYLLESAEEVIARAEQPRLLRRELIVEHATRKYTLRAKSALLRQFLLLENGVQIGSISPEGLLTRRAEVEPPSELPMLLQVFIIWLVMTLWKHDDGVGVAAGAAAAGSA
jgi:hypothetical protein